MFEVFLTSNPELRVACVPPFPPVLPVSLEPGIDAASPREIASSS
jgi:hypothetical protein